MKTVKQMLYQKYKIKVNKFNLLNNNNSNINSAKMIE